MNKETLKAALQTELNRQFQFGPIMFHPSYNGEVR